MTFIDRGSRVGLSQGASIFWGLVSVFFAAAACFYYWKNSENETTANVMRDQVIQLRDDNASLTSQKDNLQASRAEAESQLKAREDLVNEKETQLAAEETRLEGLGQKSQDQSQQNLAQAAVVKKFNDLIRKLAANSPADVVERGGRPVLRLPNADLFAPGDAALKPEGKALLTQIAQAFSGQMDGFELRVVSYTDASAEASDADSAASKTSNTPDEKKKDASAKPGANDAVAAMHYATSWDLTAARAATLARFYREQTPLPFLDVLTMGRGDAEPIVANGGGDSARNRRVEITITPAPAPFHPADADKSSAHAATASASFGASASPAHAKAKAKASDKGTGH